MSTEYRRKKGRVRRVFSWSYRSEFCELMASIPGDKSAAYSGATEAKRAIPRLLAGCGGLGWCHRLARLPLFHALLSPPLLHACRPTNGCGDTCRDECNWNANDKGTQPAISRAAAAAGAPSLMVAFSYPRRERRMMESKSGSGRGTLFSIAKRCPVGSAVAALLLLLLLLRAAGAAAASLLYRVMGRSRSTCNRRVDLLVVESTV